MKFVEHPVTLSYIGRIKADCENKKPDIRERAQKNGFDVLDSIELAALLIGCGTKGNPVMSIAKEVWNCALNYQGSKHFMQQLMKIKGISASKACCLVAAVELGRRLFAGSGEKITSPRDALPFLQHYAMQMQEHFICISLNGAHEVLKLRVVAVGTLNRTLVHPREVFSGPLQDHCAAVVLCHNHPSGTNKPSDDDIQITNRLKQAADILGILLLDHIIITRTDYFSFAEHFLLE